MTFSIRPRQKRARECTITTGNEGLSQPRKYEKPDILSSNGRRLLFHFDRKASVNKRKDEWQDGKVSCGFLAAPIRSSIPTQSSGAGQCADYISGRRVHTTWIHSLAWIQSTLWCQEAGKEWTLPSPNNNITRSCPHSSAHLLYWVLLLRPTASPELLAGYF